MVVVVVVAVLVVTVVEGGESVPVLLARCVIKVTAALLYLALAAVR